MKKSNLGFAAIVIVMLSIMTLGVLNRIVINKNEIERISDTKAEIIATQLKTDYQAGFQEGFNAFINQFGAANLAYTPPELVAKYASDNSDDNFVESYTSDDGSAPSQSEKEQGYVDGYHRAANAFYCPR